MDQQISIITLGVEDINRSVQFYVVGFGWSPIFRNEEIAFFQMNGFVFGVWTRTGLVVDSGRTVQPGPGAFALAHNVRAREDVQPLIDRLVAAGGKRLRDGDVPPHGGLRGYVADPDGHAWEIAWNPAWAIDPAGHVSFGV